MTILRTINICLIFTLLCLPHTSHSRKPKGGSAGFLVCNTSGGECTTLDQYSLGKAFAPSKMQEVYPFIQEQLNILRTKHGLHKTAELYEGILSGKLAQWYLTDRDLGELPQDGEQKSGMSFPRIGSNDQDVISIERAEALKLSAKDLAHSFVHEATWSANDDFQYRRNTGWKGAWNPGRLEGEIMDMTSGVIMSSELGEMATQTVVSRLGGVAEFPCVGDFYSKHIFEWYNFNFSSGNRREGFNPYQAGKIVTPATRLSMALYEDVTGAGFLLEGDLVDLVQSQDFYYDLVKAGYSQSIYPQQVESSVYFLMEKETYNKEIAKTKLVYTLGKIDLTTRSLEAHDTVSVRPHISQFACINVENVSPNDRVILYTQRYMRKVWQEDVAGYNSENVIFDLSAPTQPSGISWFSQRDDPGEIRILNGDDR